MVKKLRISNKVQVYFGNLTLYFCLNEYGLRLFAMQPKLNSVAAFGYKNLFLNVEMATLFHLCFYQLITGLTA
jgi:hypothetical protein